MRHALVNTIILAGTKPTITNETSPLPAKRTTHERYTVILKKYGDNQFFLEKKSIISQNLIIVMKLRIFL